MRTLRLKLMNAALGVALLLVGCTSRVHVVGTDALVDSSMLVGEYLMADGRFVSADISLCQDGTFTYSYSGCVGEEACSGTWTLVPEYVELRLVSGDSSMFWANDSEGHVSIDPNGEVLYLEVARLRVQQVEGDLWLIDESIPFPRRSEEFADFRRDTASWLPLGWNQFRPLRVCKRSPPSWDEYFDHYFDLQE